MIGRRKDFLKSKDCTKILDQGHIENNLAIFWAVLWANSIYAKNFLKIRNYSLTKINLFSKADAFASEANYLISAGIACGAKR